MTNARAYIVGLDGHPFHIIDADDDAAAIRAAEKLVNGNVEVWCLNRKIAVFPREKMKSVAGALGASMDARHAFPPLARAQRAGM